MTRRRGARTRASAAVRRLGGLTLGTVCSALGTAIVLVPTLYTVQLLPERVGLFGWPLVLIVAIGFLTAAIPLLSYGAVLLVPRLAEEPIRPKRVRRRSPPPNATPPALRPSGALSSWLTRPSAERSGPPRMSDMYGQDRGPLAAAAITAVLTAAAVAAVSAYL